MTKFDPSEHMMKLKGKDYLQVTWRVVWFRSDHPDWKLETRLIEHDAEAGRAVFRATVSMPGNEALSNQVLATGHKQETRKAFADYLEKAETGAIGRALAALGYGTQFAELDEGDGEVVDSPVATTYLCDVCRAPVLDQFGQPVNDNQVHLIAQRYGRLVCKEHKP